MSHKAKSAQVVISIYANYEGNDFDVEQLKKDVMSNVNHFIENKGLRMNEHTQTSPNDVELTQVSIDADLRQVHPRPPVYRSVYVRENFDGTFDVQTHEGKHICFVETFSEDTPIEEIRSQGYVPILERYPAAKIRCYLGSKDLFVKA